MHPKSHQPTSGVFLSIISLQNTHPPSTEKHPQCCGENVSCPSARSEGQTFTTGISDIENVVLFSYRFNGDSADGIKSGGGKQYPEIVILVNPQYPGLHLPILTFRKHIEKIWEEVWRTVFLITYGHSQTYWRIRLIGHIILEITEHILTWPILFNKDSGPLSMHKNFT